MAKEKLPVIPGNLEEPFSQDTVDLGGESKATTLEQAAPPAPPAQRAAETTPAPREEAPSPKEEATAASREEAPPPKEEATAALAGEAKADYALLSRPEQYDTWDAAGAAMIAQAESNLNDINSAYATEAPERPEGGEMMPQGEIGGEPIYDKPGIWDTLVGWKGDLIEKKRELGDYIASTGVGQAIDEFWSARGKYYLFDLYAKELSDTSPTDANLRVAYAFMTRVSTSMEGLHLFGGRDPETVERDRKNFLWAQEVIERGGMERGWRHGQPALSFLGLLQDTPQALGYWYEVINGSLSGYFGSPLNLLLTAIPIAPLARLGRSWQMAGARAAYNMGARTAAPIVAAAVGGRVLGGATAGFVHQAALDLFLYHPQYAGTLELMGFEPPETLDSMLYAGLTGALMGGGIGLLTAPWKRLHASAKAGLEYPYKLKDVTPESPIFQGLKSDIEEAADNYTVDIYNRAGGPFADSNYAHGSRQYSLVPGLTTPETTITDPFALPQVINVEPEPPVIIVAEPPPSTSLEQPIALPDVINIGSMPSDPEAIAALIRRASEPIGGYEATGEGAGAVSDTGGIDAIEQYTDPSSAYNVNTDAPLDTTPFQRVDAEIVESEEAIRIIEAAQNAQAQAPSGPTGAPAQNAQAQAPGAPTGAPTQATAGATAQNVQTQAPGAPQGPSTLTGVTAQNAQALKDRAQKILDLAQTRKKILPIIQKAEVAFQMALEKIKTVSGAKLKFSPEVEALIKALSEGSTVIDQVVLDKMIAEIKTKEQAVQATLKSAVKTLNDALQILNLAKPFVQGKAEVTKDLNNLINQVNITKGAVNQRIRLLELLTSVMEGYKKRLNSPLTPVRAVEEFIQTLNQVFDALSPPQAAPAAAVQAAPAPAAQAAPTPAAAATQAAPAAQAAQKPISPRALAKILITIKNIVQNNTAETSTYIGINNQYKVHAEEGKKYGIQPERKAQELLDEIQANIEAAEKIIREINQLTQEIVQLNSQILPSGGAAATPDMIIARALQLKDLQQKINMLAIKVLRHSQINATINRLFNRATKIIKPTPPGLISGQPSGPINAVFAQVPNVPQLLKNQAFNKRGMTLLLKALRAQGLSDVDALKAALDIETIAEFVDKVSTEQGHQEVTTKLKEYEQRLKNRPQQPSGDLEELAYPFAEMRKADVVFRRAIKTIGKIHRYIIKKGGVQAFHDSKRISIGTIEKILKDIYDVLQVLKNMDRLDLSADKLADDTVKYIKSLEGLYQYLQDVKHYRMGLDTVAAPLVDKKAHIIGTLSARFEKNYLFEFTDFFGLYQINPPNSLMPTWHFSHSNTLIPIGSFEDLGDIFNAVYMHWLENSPSATPKGWAAKFVGNFINSLLGRGTPESLTKAGLIKGMLLDLYHKENAALNEINGNLWLGITDKEGGAIRANTFDPDANHYFHEMYTTGKSSVHIKDPHLKSGLNKLVENARQVDKALREAWRRLGFPVQEIENYIPQNHDRLKIRMVTKDQFVKAVLPLLDTSKMKIPTTSPEGRILSPMEIEQAQREWLGAVYDHLTAHPDSGLNYEGGEMGSLFAERQLHFKDTDSFLQYQAAFGSSHFVIQSLTDHFYKGGRQQALARTFGPASGRLIKDMHTFFTAQLDQIKRTGVSPYGSEREIVTVINALYELMNPVEGVVYPNAGVKVLKTTEGLTISALLRNVCSFGMTTELYQIERTKQNLGLSPPTTPFISLLKALGLSVPEIMSWLLRPATAFYEALANLSAPAMSNYSDLAFAGLLFHDDTQLVSRTNRTPSTMRYPWAQETEQKIDKVAGTSRQTMRNRHKAGVFFQREMVEHLETSWDNLPPAFRTYLIRAGLRAEDWGKLQAAKQGGYLTANVAPEDLGGRVGVKQFSPAVFMRTYGTPGTVGYHPELAEIGKKLMIAQSLFIGEAVLQTNPYVKGFVIKKGTGRVTQTRQGLVALLVDLAMSSLTLFTGWGQTFVHTYGRYGGWGGIAAFMVGGFVIGMFMLSVRAAARGQKFDWTSWENVLRGFLAVGGGNYLDVLINDGLHMFQESGTLGSKARAISQKGFHPALDTIFKFADLGKDVATWENQTTAERSRSMGRFRKIHDLLIPDPYQAISNRFLLDNLLHLLDPDAADKLFRQEIKNKSIYTDAEYIRGLKPGDWTSQALPESLRDKKQYQEAKQARRAKKNKKSGQRKRITEW